MLADHHVFQDAHVLEQSHRLESSCDARPSDLVWRQPNQVAPLKQDLTAIRLTEAGDDIEKCGFTGAGAVGADDADNLRVSRNFCSCRLAAFSAVQVVFAAQLDFVAVDLAAFFNCDLDTAQGI